MTDRLEELVKKASQGKPYGGGKISNDGGIKIDKPLILKHSLIQENEKKTSYKEESFWGDGKN